MPVLHGCSSKQSLFFRGSGLRVASYWQGADAVSSHSQKASGGQTLAKFWATGSEQVGATLCVPLQQVALKADITASFSVTEEVVPAPSLYSPCATPFACNLLLCCKIWTLQFVAVLFGHKPWTLQDIASYDIASYCTCARLSWKVCVLLALTSNVKTKQPYGHPPRR